MVGFRTVIGIIASIFSIIGTALGIYFGVKAKNTSNVSNQPTATISSDIPTTTNNIAPLCPVQTTKWYSTSVCSDTAIVFYTSGTCFQWHTSTGYSDYLGGCNGYNLTVVHYSDSQCLIEVSKSSFVATSDCFLPPFVSNNYYKMC